MRQTRVVWVSTAPLILESVLFARSHGRTQPRLSASRISFLPTVVVLLVLVVRGRCLTIFFLHTLSTNAGRFGSASTMHAHGVKYLWSLPRRSIMRCVLVVWRSRRLVLQRSDSRDRLCHVVRAPPMAVPPRSSQRWSALASPLRRHFCHLTRWLCIRLWVRALAARTLLSLSPFCYFLPPAEPWSWSMRQRWTRAWCARLGHRNR